MKNEFDKNEKSSKIIRRRRSFFKKFFKHHRKKFFASNCEINFSPSHLRFQSNFFAIIKVSEGKFKTKKANKCKSLKIHHQIPK